MRCSLYLQIRSNKLRKKQILSTLQKNITVELNCLCFPSTYLGAASVTRRTVMMIHVWDRSEVRRLCKLEPFAFLKSCRKKRQAECAKPEISGAAAESVTTTKTP